MLNITSYRNFDEKTFSLSDVNNFTTQYIYIDINEQLFSYLIFTSTVVCLLMNIVLFF